MANFIRIPVKNHDSYNWAQLALYGKDQILCGEDFRTEDQNYSFVGGHRVRLYKIKKNVHWRIPQGFPLDIAGVTPATPPPRRQTHH
jgi:hypothetical protein